MCCDLDTRALLVLRCLLPDVTHEAMTPLHTPLLSSVPPPSPPRPPPLPRLDQFAFPLFPSRLPFVRSSSWTPSEPLSPLLPTSCSPMAFPHTACPPASCVALLPLLSIGPPSPVLPFPLPPSLSSSPIFHYIHGPLLPHPTHPCPFPRLYRLLILCPPFFYVHLPCRLIPLDLLHFSTAVSSRCLHSSLMIIIITIAINFPFFSLLSDCA